ncbi:MAG: hypothetical protein V4667_09965 [Bacteroidota bacterium]
MKTTNFAFAFFFLICFAATAQIDYKTQPKNGYYEDLKKLVLPVIPSQAQLIAAKAEVIPNGFKDTLLKYDWYEIANYYFYDKEYSSYFLDDLESREKIQASNQFNFCRYTTKGVRYDMSLFRYKDGSLKVNHTTFDENIATKLSDVKKVGTKFMMVTLVFGEQEMNEILSYKNGVMILNIKQSPSATVKRYHIAYMAVPKGF